MPDGWCMSCGQYASTIGHAGWCPNRSPKGDQMHEDEARGVRGNDYQQRVLRHLEQIEALLRASARDHLVAHALERFDARLERMETKLGILMTMSQQSATREVEQMAFAQDVLARITAQTTLIGSIKAWIQALPTDVVSAEDKAAILANLDTNSAELSTAIPANVPPVDPNNPPA